MLILNIVLYSMASAATFNTRWRECTIGC